MLGALVIAKALGITPEELRTYLEYFGEGIELLKEMNKTLDKIHNEVKYIDREGESNAN